MVQVLIANRGSKFNGNLQEQENFSFEHLNILNTFVQ